MADALDVTDGDDTRPDLRLNILEVLAEPVAMPLRPHGRQHRQVESPGEVRCTECVARRSGDWFPTGKAPVAVLLVGLVLAVAAAVVQSWAFAGSAVILAVLSFTSDKGMAWWSARRAEVALRVSHQRDTSLYASGDAAELPVIATLSDQQLGVHPSSLEVGYQDRGLPEQKLVHLVQGAHPVVVVGDPLSGKTRMAVEVVRRQCGGRQVWYPVAPAGLADRLALGAPQGCIVWLDHLERYLSAPGLRLDWIDALTRCNNTLVATMDSSEHRRITTGGEIRHPMGASVERLNPVWLVPDDTERAQLADAMPTESARKGVRKYGLGEYLGGGYLAVESYLNGVGEYPLGAAILRAATDWRRLGGDLVFATTLSELGLRYLTGLQAEDHESVDRALAWGQTKIASATRLLEKVGEEHYRVHAYLADYLSKQAGPIPDVTWAAAMALANSPLTAFILGSRAYDMDRRVDAAALFERSTTGTDTTISALAWASLGVIRHEEGDLVGAEQAYRAGASLHDPDNSPMAAVGLAVLLQGQGDVDGAEEAYRQAIDCGRPDRSATAWYGLGYLLEDRHDVEGAVAAYAQAMASAPSDRAAAAALRCGDLMRHEGDPIGAATAYRRAVDLNHAEFSPGAACQLGIMLHHAGQWADARTAYESALKWNDSEASPQAAMCLGILCRERGLPADAEAAFRAAMGSGHTQVAPAAALDLAVLITSQARLTEARELCAIALSASDPEVRSRAQGFLAVLNASG